MKTYLVGIDAVSREYYLVHAESESDARLNLALFASGELDDENAVTFHDREEEGDLLPDSVGDPVPFEDDDDEDDEGYREEAARIAIIRAWEKAATA